MRTLNLDFWGPYDFISPNHDVMNDCEYANEPGIYLWTVKMPDLSYKIVYVGETRRSFYERTREHLLNQLSGVYEIQDNEKMKQGIKSIVWAGLYGNGRRDKIYEYISRYDELSVANIKYLSLIKIFVAPLDIEDSIRQTIEEKLATCILGNNAAGSIYPLGIHYKTHEVKEELKVEISSSSLIQGLPKCIKFNC